MVVIPSPSSPELYKLIILAHKMTRSKRSKPQQTDMYIISRDNVDVAKEDRYFMSQ